MRNDLIKAEKVGKAIIENNPEYGLTTGEVFDLIERSGGEIHALVAAYYIGIFFGTQIERQNAESKQEATA